MARSREPLRHKRPSGLKEPPTARGEICGNAGPGAGGARAVDGEKLPRRRARTRGSLRRC
eukprot:scaffold4604_cov257-Pinguiococcus_pyrenoidosus.AAC.4